MDEEETTPLVPSTDKRAVIEDVDDAISAAGIGWFQVFVFVVSGLSFTADAMEVTLLGFLYSCLKDYWDLGNFTADTIVSCVFAGELIGSVVAGPLSDIFGRRTVSIGGSGILAAAGLLSAASSNVWMFIVFRTIVGFGVGSMIVPFDLLCETTPTHWRGWVLTVYEVWWAFGSMYCVAIAWLFLSNDGWRVLVVLCAVPVVLSFITLFFLPESPHWLVSEGRIEEAEEVIKKIARWNDVDLPRLQLKKQHEGSYHPSHADLTALFSPKLLSTTLAINLIWLAFGFTFYGVSLLLTRVSSESSDDCSFNYPFLFTVYSMEIPGIVFLMLTINSLGRVGSQALSYGLAAIATVIVGLTNAVSYESAFIFGCVALAAAMSASSATWVITPELFPTEVRSSAHSLANATARVGAFFASYVVDSSMTLLVASIILGVVNLLASGVSFALPETKDRHLD